MTPDTARMVQALLDIKQMQSTLPPAAFALPPKDQARVANTPYPPPTMPDVPQGLVLPGAAPVLPPNFTGR